MEPSMIAVCKGGRKCEGLLVLLLKFIISFIITSLPGYFIFFSPLSLILLVLPILEFILKKLSAKVYLNYGHQLPARHT